MATAARLIESLSSAGWDVEVIPAGRGFGGLATLRDADDDGPPLRLTAWGLDQGSVVLLLFEQACARALVGYERTG